ncbi:MAG: STAS domain-containing protein [Acidimicrobiales bacterium]
MNSGPPFSALISHQGATVIVRVAGELDLASSPRLQTTIVDLISGPPLHLTIDLTDLAFADLSGLRALDAVGHDVSRAGARFCLIGVKPYLLRIMQVAEFGDLERACETTTVQLQPGG